MVPKEVLAKVGNFNVQLMTGQDRELWIRVALYYRVAWSPMETAVYHLSAVNRRAGSISYPDAVHANTIESFLQSGIPSVSSRRSIEEYLVSMRLGLAKQNYVRGHEAWARELLRKTKETQLFSRHRRLCQLAFCFPPSCLKMLQSLHAFLHRVF